MGHLKINKLLLVIILTALASLVGCSLFYLYLLKTPTENNPRQKTSEDRLVGRVRQESIDGPNKYYNRGRQWLVLIAIDDYLDNSRLPDLKTCVNDATTFRDILYNCYSYRSENTIELFNEDATENNVKQTMADLLEKTSTSDSLIMYFAGHGIYKNKVGYLFFHDSTLGLSHYILTEWCKGAKAQQFLVVSDSCFSASTFQSSISDDEGTRGNLCRQLLTAGGMTTVMDSSRSDSTHSPFNIALQNSLLTLGKEGSKFTLERLYSNMLEKVREESGTSQEPRHGKIPGGNDSGGQFFFYPNSTFTDEYIQYTTSVKIERSKQKSTFEKIRAWKSIMVQHPHGKYNQEAIERYNYWTKQLKPGQQQAFRLSPTTKLTVCWVPPGTFTMGSEKAKTTDEKPFQASLESGFWLGEAEVTNAQFAQFVDETGYQTTAEIHQNGRDFVSESNRIGYRIQEDLNWTKLKQHPNLPVILVSYEDASAFCDWFSKKFQVKATLPSEAQWEYACRGGTKKDYYWGNDTTRAAQYANIADQTLKKKIKNIIAVDCDDGFAQIGPVKSKKPTAFNLYDLHGNVWEWCRDSYGSYPTSAQSNWVQPEESDYYILRGGSFTSGAEEFRCAYRFAEPLNHTRVDVGFRLCIEQ